MIAYTKSPPPSPIHTHSLTHIHTNAVNSIVAYLLNAKTVEPQQQPFISNTRTQQWKQRGYEARF
jgi:hypothetical protein